MFRSSFATVIVAGIGATSLTAIGAHATVAGDLLPHRAVYDLELKEASDRSGISAIYGRMVYEFNGSTCTGYTTNFRFVTQIDSGDNTHTTDQQTTTFEDLAKGVFTFETKSYTDEQLDKEVCGSAEEAKDRLKIALTQPGKRDVELAASRFPTEHMLDVIENAKKGSTLFESRIFDGSDNGDQMFLTTTVVGKLEKPGKADSDAKVAGNLASTPFWPVTIAYFNDKAVGDATPEYRMSFKLYENGVTRDLTMDYGAFVLTGKLTKLEPLNPAACK